jgi:hypothetical protein
MIAIAAIIHAAKLAIDILNRSVTAGKSFQRSIDPSAISILAAGTQDAIPNANVAASLCVIAAWHCAILFANQVAVVVGDIAPAAVRAIQHSVMVTAEIILATRAQVVASHGDVFTALLVGPRWIIIHWHGARSSGPAKDHDGAHGHQHQISHKSPLVRSFR